MDVASGCLVAQRISDARRPTRCLATTTPDDRFARDDGRWRPVLAQVADELLACGVLHAARCRAALRSARSGEWSIVNSREWWHFDNLAALHFVEYLASERKIDAVRTALRVSPSVNAGAFIPNVTRWTFRR